MAVKKTTRVGHKKSAKAPKRMVAVAALPDVFDEEPMLSAEAPEVSKVQPTHIPEASIEPQDLPVPRAPRGLAVETQQESDFPQMEAPSFTVKEQGKTISQDSLPSFFSDDEPVKTLSEPEVVRDEPTMSSQATEQFIETSPHAFVGEVNTVATSVKQEKKGALVTFFIILGMLLVSAGIVGLFILGARQNGKTSATPVAVPTQTPSAQATPSPTPTVVVNTASPSASLAPKADLKVNVLNGTAVKGLAAKEAANLKKEGYTIGTVGNGEPSLAGTITVPSGETATGDAIAAVLSNYTFTVKEEEKATSITVVLPEANE